VQKYPSTRVTWSAALLATVFLCLMAYLFAWQLTASGSSGKLNATLLPCTADQRIVPLRSGVLFSDGTHLHALDSRGRQVWAHLAGTGSGFDVSEGGVSVWLGNKLTLLSAETGVPFALSGTVTGNILSARLGTIYAAVQTGTEHNSTLYVLSRDGGRVDEVAMPDQTVLDYGFFSGGSLLWTLSLDTEGTIPKSVITTRRPGRAVTGDIQQTRQILYKAFFHANDLRAVDDSFLHTFNYQGKEDLESRILVYGWHLVDEDGAGESALMAFVPSAQANANTPISDVRLIRGKADRTVRMPFPCFAVAAHDGKLYGFSRSHIMIRELGDDKAMTYQIPIEADRFFGMTDGGAAILASGNQVFLINTR